MLSMLGGIVGDSAVQRAHKQWGTTWMYKHPSPCGCGSLQSSSIRT
jgi:hypothetical protein